MTATTDISAHVTNNAEAENFFQSDASLRAQHKRQLKKERRGDAGKPIQCSSKILAIAFDPIAFPNEIWVAESGFVARSLRLDLAEDCKESSSSAAAATRTFAKVHTGPVTCLDIFTFSSTSSFLYTGSWDKTAVQWSLDADNSTPIVYKGHADFVKCLRVHRSLQTLFTGSADATVREWELKSGKCLRIFKGHKRGVEDLDFSEDGSKMYTAGSDGAVLIWNIDPTDPKAAKETAPIDRLEGHLTSVYKCKVHEDSLWTASADKTVKRWDLETGQCDTTFQHPDWVKSLLIVGSKLITGSRDEIIRVWDIGSEKFVRKFHGHYGEISDLVMIDNSTVLSASLDTTLRRWDLAASSSQDEVEEEEDDEFNDELLPPQNPTSIEPANGMTADEEAELEALMD